MVFWSLALVVTAVACAALYYAGAGRRVNAGGPDTEQPEFAHFRLQLREIDADAALGRMGAAEAEAARGELAREVLRAKNEARGPGSFGSGTRRVVMAMAVVATAGLALTLYSVLGNPGLPAQPLATRTDLPAPGMTLEEAVARIETRLAQVPDDLAGWLVVAPAYMQLGRFADAAEALRQVIRLDGPTAERETDLGEALMLAGPGVAAGEPMQLFLSAVARDPAHVRARYYVAAELTRTGDFTAAAAAWQELIALSTGGETWLPAAEEGLAVATAGSTGTAPLSIEAMVDGLTARLEAEGGGIDEWTRLVRSRLVLGQTELAQQAYERARAAYPDASVRTELDVLAADNGLVAN